MNFAYFRALSSPDCHLSVICLGINNSVDISLPFLPLENGFQGLDFEMKSATFISQCLLTPSISKALSSRSKHNRSYFICIPLFAAMTSRKRGLSCYVTVDGKCIMHQSTDARACNLHAMHRSADKSTVT